MLIRIRESLNKMDMDTDCKYDLVSLYESCKLTEQEKEKLVKMIYTNEDPATIFNSLNKTYTRQQGSRPSNSSITSSCFSLIVAILFLFFVFLSQEGDKPLDFPLQSYCFLYNLSF